MGRDGAGKSVLSKDPSVTGMPVLFHAMGWETANNHLGSRRPEGNQLQSIFAMMNQKIATIIVLTYLLHLPCLALGKQKEDADKKEERVEIKYLVPEAPVKTLLL